MNLNFQSQSETDIVRSTERFSNFILLDANLDKNYLGGMIVNLEGEAVGLVISSDKDKPSWVLPVKSFNGIISEVLKNGYVKRPYLGINYLDISQLAGLDLKVTSGLTAGALVYREPEVASPAHLAQIKANDIIVKIDNQLIDKNNCLNDLIQEYQVGDKVELTINRQGQVITKEVFLGIME